MNVCKKCGKELPMNYKHKKCEHCINKQADLIKKVGKVGGGIVCLALVVVTGGKFNPKK